MLQRISQQALGTVKRAGAANEDPEEQLGQAFAGLYRRMVQDNSGARLLMRDLHVSFQTSRQIQIRPIDRPVHG